MQGKILNIIILTGLDWKMDKRWQSIGADRKLQISLYVTTEISY